MSASEKLKALEQALVPFERTAITTFGEEIDHHAATEKAESFLVTSLPQIVAVVQAAELYAEVLDDAHLMESALAALDEALS